MKNKYVFILLSVLITSQCFALKPRKDYIITPDSLGLQYKELRINTPDSFAINTWVIAPDKKKDNKTVMIVAYGDAMNMSYWLEQCYYFIQEGFTIITFDYRGFGHSSPFEIDTNRLYYEQYATDLESVINYTRQEFKDYKVAVRALSMGTAITTIACSKTPIDYFIGDSFICDPVEMQACLQKMTGRPFSLPPGADHYKDDLAKLETPMLVFAGTEDGSTPLSACKLMVAGHPRRKLITYVGEHLEAIYVLSGEYFGEKYIKEIEDFLKSN